MLPFLPQPEHTSDHSTRVALHLGQHTSVSYHMPIAGRIHHFVEGEAVSKTYLAICLLSGSTRSLVQVHDRKYEPQAHPPTNITGCGCPTCDEAPLREMGLRCCCRCGPWLISVQLPSMVQRVGDTCCIGIRYCASYISIIRQVEMYNRDEYETYHNPSTAIITSSVSEGTCAQ